MSERPIGSPAAHATGSVDDPPPPEIAAFIRFCHGRRHVGWPEMYDVMCGVAARREFHGWGHDHLAARGLTFALPEMPRLAAWVRSVLAGQTDAAEHGSQLGSERFEEVHALSA